jgi:hypothetical protein
MPQLRIWALLLMLAPSLAWAGYTPTATQHHTTHHAFWKQYRYRVHVSKHRQLAREVIHIHLRHQPGRLVAARMGPGIYTLAEIATPRPHHTHHYSPAASARITALARRKPAARNIVVPPNMYAMARHAHSSNDRSTDRLLMLYQRRSTFSLSSGLA